jgi:hypothetical protein
VDRPDYALADALTVDSAEQHRALGNLTRHRILGLLAEAERAGAAAALTDMGTTTRARLDPERAADFHDRLAALVEEFRAGPAADYPVAAAYTLAVAFFRSEPELRR